ncbi:hypothetical protein BDY19DRAFT_143826 [Irpex rosettiformis]|uniref:Uncharacterized protein n=1 Tax=Irpex rosettiformis TaxID=378272 RepID=A0ACB8U3S8_9APHY|nr:hypothetical protein BDY19DRAFT_143826 [Irpex rosettiformis]
MTISLPLEKSIGTYGSLFPLVPQSCFFSIVTLPSLSISLFSEGTSTIMILSRQMRAFQLLATSHDNGLTAVQFLRVYALYGRSKKLIWLIFSIAAVLLGFSIWAVTGQSSEISLQEGCQFASSKLTAIHIATAWEALFTFDLMIFCLTIARTYKTRIRYYGVGRKMDLVTLMVRDGAMYFGVMVLVQGANVVTFYAGSPVLRGTLSTLASDVSVTMMSRLMLNLHRIAADQTDVFGTTLDPTSVYTTHGGSMQFTTGESSFSMSMSGSGSRSRGTSEWTNGEPYGHMRMPAVRVRGGGGGAGLGSSDLSTEGEESLELKDFTGVGRSFGSV